jgi:hypothetical protein
LLKRNCEIWILINVLYGKQNLQAVVEAVLLKSPPDLVSFVVLLPNRPPPAAGWLGAVAGVELAAVLLVPPKRLPPVAGAGAAPLLKRPPEAGAVVVAGVAPALKSPPPAVEAGGCAGVVDAPPNILPPAAGFAPNIPPVEG